MKFDQRLLRYVGNLSFFFENLANRQFIGFQFLFLKKYLSGLLKKLG